MSEENQTKHDFSKIYSKVKLNGGSVSDTTFSPIDARRPSRPYTKEIILNTIATLDYPYMMEISDYFYRTNGIYNRLCRYLAYMYRYDWVITPSFGEIGNKAPSERTKTTVLKQFNEAINYFDNFKVKKTLGEIALKVIKKGCYYCYITDGEDQPIIQELPYKYCRSLYKTSDGRPVVEFNMRYFDETFTDDEQRNRILAIFPPEFSKGYKLYKQRKLPPLTAGDRPGWYLLDTNHSYKFNINGEDFPMLYSVLPAITDLDDAQELQKKKMEQQLLKILIQQLPLDKNNELVFSVEEMADLHKMAVQMLGQTVGVDVLTTVANVKVEDVAEKKTNSNDDDLSKMERSVYNAAGISQNQFNSEGSLALSNSILNDEASISDLIQQFEDFLGLLLKNKFGKNKKRGFLTIDILPTTIYNYKDLAKQYKEMTNLGYSKVLSMIALGQSQSSILRTPYFENTILHFGEDLIPPMSTNTMSSSTVGSTSENKTGRPTKEEQGEQITEKTAQNMESL